MSDNPPEGLRPPFTLALARLVQRLPVPEALPGGCIYEPKWDGFRLAIIRDGDRTSLWSRQGKDLTRYFADLHAEASEQIPPGCVVDGEAVVWSNGRLDFETLQRRLTAGSRALPSLIREHPASFAAFDVLAVAGRDIRHVQLRDRRTLLEELASTWSPPLNLSPTTMDFEVAQQWFEELPATGVEGLVVKGAAQRYESGQRQWLKVKHRDALNVICAAVAGSTSRPEALIVGLSIEGELRVVGRTSQLKGSAAVQLGRLLRPPKGEHPWPSTMRRSVVDRYNSKAGELMELTLVEPIVVEISADVAWSGTSFRHSVRFLRARPELDVTDVDLPSQLG
jgi:ATP-dependent DNA ligase